MSAKKKSDDGKQQPSSGIVLTMFTAFLLIYFIARFILADRWAIESIIGYTLVIALVVFTGVIQFNSFIELSKYHCGEPQIGQVVGYTLMSNLMYVELLIVCLYFSRI